VKEGEIIEKGWISVPDRPGIGLEMNDEAVRKMQHPGSSWFAAS
jgi:galactonate dehydratase